MWSEALTPAYIFSVEKLAERVSQVRAAFGEKVGLCFSIKANPFLIPYLPPQIQKIEVCSPGELSICERLGADMRFVIFSGANKGREDVMRALRDGVGTITAESPYQIQLIRDCAVETASRPEVLLRLTAGSQFGMEEEEILAVYQQAAQNELPFEPVGIHFFSGTQKKKTAVIRKELENLVEFAGRIKQETGLSAAKLEYGTGLAVDYFSPDAEKLEEARLNEIAPFIRETGSQLELTVEMGRFFAAPCGSYLTSAVDLKKNLGVSYAIMDGGIHQLKYYGQMQGMQTPVITHLPQNDRQNGKAPEEEWTICGSLCTTGDVLARDIKLMDLQIGDRLVFHRTGAYCVMEGMSVFLSRDMPRVYMENKGVLTMVRGLVDTDWLNTPEIMPPVDKDGCP